MMTDKTELRNYYRTIRARLDPDEAIRLGRAAQDWLISSMVWKDARKIGLFASMPEEVSTDRLIVEALRKTGTVWLPQILDLKKGCMRFAACHSFHDLIISQYGIREPGPYSGQTGENETDFQPDILLIPGLAFDLRGTRLGYGGGFYDRILPDFQGCHMVGFCYSCQLAQRLPRRKWDIPVKYICTEKGFICL